MSPTYTIVLKNGTKGRITDAAVKYGDFTSVGGILDPGVKKMHAGVRQKPPKVVEVVWVAEDGTSFRRKVNVDLPRDVSQVVFEIGNDSTVRVTPGE